MKVHPHLYICYVTVYIHIPCSLLCFPNTVTLLIHSTQDFILTSNGPPFQPFDDPSIKMPVQTEKGVRKFRSSKTFKFECVPANGILLLMNFY